ncbi:MAG: hypothetical protein N3A61_04600 [Ignavibacteria bacterium]|nr:hypothetical protein [Ignavibacteria bacterium]
MQQNSHHNKAVENPDLQKKYKLKEYVSHQNFIHSKISISSCMLTTFEKDLQSILDDRDIIEVNFKCQRKEFVLNPEHLNLNYFDYVLIEGENGIDLGYVTELEELTKIKRQSLGLCHEQLNKVIRLATDDEIKKLYQQRRDEEEARPKFEDLVKKNELDMKLVEVEYQFDRSRLTFYFISDTRVDFRQLVKDLAAIYKTRIELRQIGAREGAKKFGGIGSCGQELCCCTFLDDIKKISFHNLRDQRLFINPNKLNGQCGRLKCCLAFETNLYNEVSSKFPLPHTILKLPEGDAVVEHIDIYSDIVYLYFPEEDIHQKYKLDELNHLIENN